MNVTPVAPEILRYASRAEGWRGDLSTRELGADVEDSAYALTQRPGARLQSKRPWSRSDNGGASGLACQP